jgi:antitoxin FitA
MFGILGLVLDSKSLIHSAIASKNKDRHRLSQRLKILIMLHFPSIQRVMAVASITIDISDEQLQKLQAIVRESGISLEDLLRARIEDWLSHPTREFAQAANYVLKKNAQLYRRLA